MKEINNRRHFLVNSMKVGAAVCSIGVPFFAQSSPLGPLAGKTATVIVPFGPGGTADVLARVMADAMSKSMGMNIIVENKLGAGGSIAAAQIARAKPDGLTFGVASLSTHAASPAVTAKPAYDPIKDFSSIGMIAKVPLAFVATPQSGMTSISDIVSKLKDKPESLAFGSPGVGSLGHLIFEQFQQLAGVQMLHVPYKGGAEVSRALLSGEVDISITNLPNELAQIKAKKLTLIAVTGEARNPAFPDTPTFAQAGYPALNDQSWFGFVAPKGVAAEVLAAYTDALNFALEQPAIKERISTLGGTAAPGSAQSFSLEISRAYKQASDIAKSRNIVIN